MIGLSFYNIYNLEILFHCSLLISGLQDDELPRGEPNVSRRSIAWSEGFDAALAKWGSEAAFQEQVLRRMTRSQKKVDCLYMPELQSRRKRFYKRLRMGEKYAAMNDILVKNKNTHIYLSYFEPQLIGEHYINGLDSASFLNPFL